MTEKHTKKEEAEEKRRLRLEKERDRVAAMRAFELDAVRKVLGTSDSVNASEREASASAASGGILVCGIDEAGRGPLAGPVAAGACILPMDHDILWLNDSKKLSPKKREELYQVIIKEAIAWNVVMVSPERIDEINILQADYEAMREAVLGLHCNPLMADGGSCVVPDVLVVDAVTIPDIAIPQTGIIKADAKCLSVAAASILAKVTRDHYMEEMDRKYPEYGFARNKGYGTREHIEALKQYGPCPIHRKTFIGHFVETV